MTKYTPEDRELTEQINNSKKIDLASLKQKLDRQAQDEGGFDGASEEGFIHRDDDLANFENVDPMRLAQGGIEGKSLFHVDLDEAVGLSAMSMGTEKLGSILQQTSLLKKASGDGVQFTTHRSARSKAGRMNQEFVSQGLSSNQVKALQKYPALIDVLGSDEGEKIVKEIAAKVTSLVVEKIGANTKQVNKFATSCIADRQNIKQYFVGENEEWACCVTASGPFRGDESIWFDPETDKAAILRASKDDYVNVSEGFNVIHEFAKK